MLITPTSNEERVTTAHRARRAFIYVRQSTTGQVRQHQESTQLQYRLVDRAILLGWPRERVEVIDEDLGRSGATSDGRRGFQRLIAEIGLGKAGLVLSLDASRLARNNRDWHQLLELCSLFGVIIADGERLYDPTAYHDRLLLGLSGIMSEAELHQIRVRLHQGERQKAARGELRLPLPVGLVHQRDGMVGLNPDEEVQARLGLVFAKFAELGSAKAVVRYLRTAGLTLPVRPLRGPEPHEVVWQPADSARVLHILKNPAYAGAYVYGRRRQDPQHRRSGAQRCGTVAVPVPEWPVCLRNAQPGYLGWEAYMANRKRLSDNLGRYGSGKPGLPRKGRALLQGIAICGRCGRRMTLGYSGPQGDYPVYRCVADKHQQGGGPGCQEVRAMAIDAEVERLVLAALAPDQLAMAIAALEEFAEEARLLERQWSLKRERARYEAERARRQYDAVEPENRLVARSLERAWEERLRVMEQVEHEYEHWRREQPVYLTETDRTELLELGRDFPRIWHAAGTAADVRKRIIRLVVQEVVLDQKRAPGQVWFRVGWQTGAVSEHRLRRRVQAYDGYADLGRLEQRVQELNGRGKMDAEIAAILNAEGLVSARGCPFSGPGIHLLRKRWSIRTVKINGSAFNPPRWPDATYSVQGVAKMVGVTTQTVFKWIRAQILPAEQMAKGMPWKITMPDDRVAELLARLRRTKRSTRRAS